tara:strand:- start:471812 stop:472450 length:639 start_codon:yes stop_codon:yes gene_type:complete
MKNMNTARSMAIILIAAATSSALSDLYDYSFTGTLDNLDEFEVTARMNTDATPTIDTPFNSSYFGGVLSDDAHQVIVSASMRLNDVVTVFDENYLRNHSSHFVGIVDESPDGARDAFGISIFSSDPDSDDLLFIDFRSFLSNSNLLGTDLPASSHELDPLSFESAIFEYRNSDGNSVGGNIEQVTVSQVFPSPSGLALLSVAGLVGSRRRRA